MTFWLSRGRKTRRRTSGNEVSDDPFSCSLLVDLSNGLSSKYLGWVFGSYLAAPRTRRGAVREEQKK